MQYVWFPLIWKISFQRANSLTKWLSLTASRSRVINLTQKEKNYTEVKLDSIEILIIISCNQFKKKKKSMLINRSMFFLFYNFYKSNCDSFWLIDYFVFIFILSLYLDSWISIFIFWVARFIKGICLFYTLILPWYTLKNVKIFLKPYIKFFFFRLILKFGTLDTEIDIFLSYNLFCFIQKNLITAKIH